MKFNLLVLVFILSYSSTIFAKNTLLITSNLHNVTTLKKVSKLKFEKFLSTTSGPIRIDTNINGEERTFSQEINEGNSLSDLSIEVTGKNIIRIEDKHDSVNGEVEADITKSLFGGAIKSIIVNSNAYKGLYADALKKSGLDFLSKLKIVDSTNDLDVSFLIDIKDLNCEAKEDLLICKQDAEISISVNL